MDPREGGGREIPVGEIALPGRHALARYLVERWCDEPNVARERRPIPRPAAFAWP